MENETRTKYRRLKKISSTNRPPKFSIITGLIHEKGNPKGRGNPEVGVFTNTLIYPQVFCKFFSNTNRLVLKENKVNASSHRQYANSDTSSLKKVRIFKWGTQ